MYGTEIDTLLKIAEEDKILKKPLNGDGEIAAQVVFGIRNEMAKSLPDILFRRTGLGTLGHPGNEVLEFIADIAAKESGWNISWKKEEIEKVEMLFVINDN